MLIGSFLSHNYFSSPIFGLQNNSAISFVKESFSFRYEINKQSKDIFQSIPKDTNRMLVCINLRNFIFSQSSLSNNNNNNQTSYNNNNNNNHNKNIINSNSSSLYYYLNAIYHLVSLHHQLTVVIVNENNSIDLSFVSLQKEFIRITKERFSDKQVKLIYEKRIEGNYFLMMKFISLFPVIVGYRSPFSWWSSFLCEIEKCIVIVPSLQFRNLDNQYYLPQWTVLKG